MCELERPDMTRYFTKEHEWVEVDGQSAKVLMDIQNLLMK